MLFKFYTLKEKDFFKKYYYYYCLFFIIEAFLGFSIYFSGSTNDILGYLMGYVSNIDKDFLITINKLLVIAFIAYTYLKNREYSFQFSQSCFVGRINKKKLFLNIYLFNFLLLILIDLILVLIAFLISKLIPLNFLFNIYNIIAIINMQLIIASLSCLIFDRKNIIIIFFLILSILIYYNEVYFNIVYLLLVNFIVFIIQINCSNMNN